MKRIYEINSIAAHPTIKLNVLKMEFNKNKIKLISFHSFIGEFDFIMIFFR